MLEMTWRVRISPRFDDESAPSTIWVRVGRGDLGVAAVAVDERALHTKYMPLLHMRLHGVVVRATSASSRWRSTSARYIARHC